MLILDDKIEDFEVVFDEINVPPLPDDVVFEPDDEEVQVVQILLVVIDINELLLLDI